MHPLHRHPATALAALAALVALCGCGSGGDGSGDGTAKAGALPTRPVTDDGAAAGPGTAEPEASQGPVLPDSRITPATGTFTKREKKYLSGRVPQNMDPAAVLQEGQEACQRVARTAKHDKDAAVGAVIAGDIPGAKDAIAHLCPGQKPVLKAAQKGFPDGTHKKPAAGTYRALTSATDCTWQALGASDKVLASGPGPGAGKKITAKIPAGTRTFESAGCYAWVPA